MKRKVLIFGLCLLEVTCALSAKDKKSIPLYKDAKVPIEKRVDDLLSRMTLEEKILQLNQYTMGRNNNVNNIGEEVKKVPAEIGSLIYYDTNPALRNNVQKKAMEESRLGIPIIFGYDAIHGFRTVYPISLGQACSWNPELVEKACAVTAQEARMSGVDWTFSPMIDVARDPRWGRVAEGYGEDPYTNGVFAAASVRGYQGDDMSAEDRIAACLKHYIGYGASEAGRDYVYTEISRQTLWDTYLLPYEMGVKAGAATLMSSFNDISGIPGSANHYTMTEILKERWGHDGFIVSDWGAIEQLKNQGLAANKKEAAVYAFNAGLEMDMMSHAYDRHMKELVEEEENLLACKGNMPSDEMLTSAKKDGFSDKYLSQLLEIPEEDIRNKRISIGVEEAWEGVHVSGTPDSAYYYSTYNAEDKNPVSTDKQKIMILGGGPNRIGQGIEFDYCCVHASQALKKMGFETIIVNCNPETVSTDYDTSDKLYFEPLTVEDVLSIYNKEKPLGVIAQFGGQTPLNIAAELEKNGVKILGTSPSVIDLAEDRDLFREMMDKLEIPMPESGMATTVEEALEIAGKIGYPVMVRPSYVLGGRGMEVVYDDESMAGYMKAAVGVTPDRPILIDRFLNHAMECEADAISDGTHAFVPAVMEHIELAGVHSGDSACILPSVHISEENLETIKEYTRKIAEEMHVKGLMNMQYAIEDDKVYVLEANPRASRTVPLVSKVCNVRMVPLATQIITSELTGKPSPVPELKEQAIPYYGVKEAAFPFNMFQEVDPVLGPEKRSTGEVLGLSKSYGEAFYKAQEGVGAKLPLGGTVLISVNRKDKEEVVEVAKAFADDGFKILATENTCKLIKEAGIEAEKVNKLSEGRPNILDLITNGNIDIIVNSPVGKDSVNDDSYLRKGAIKAKIPYYTTIAAAKAAAEGIAYVKAHQDQNEEVNSLQGLHAQISDKL